MARPTRSPSSRRSLYWLLAIPFAATLFPQVYASGGPALWGIPFFYWYQLAWIVASGIVTGAVYLLTR
jgi:hypothetical protein